jgi:hypothetical protein
MPTDPDLTPEALDALQERLRRIEWGVTGEPCAAGNVDETAALEADTAITALRAQLAEVEAERDAAIAAMSEAARKRGEAEGKLAASEMAGVVEGWRDRALKAEARLATARADAVRVKPLVWKTGQALTSTGNYIVVQEDWDQEPFWFVLRNGKPAGKLGEHSTEEAAKAAAQADYEARILAALEPTPSAPSPEAVARAALEWAEVKALVEAAQIAIDVMEWVGGENDCTRGIDALEAALARIKDAAP